MPECAGRGQAQAEERTWLGGHLRSYDHRTRDNSGSHVR
jgi:hypothetical protein